MVTQNMGGWYEFFAVFALFFVWVIVQNPDEELVVVQDIFGRYGYMDKFLPYPER